MYVISHVPFVFLRPICVFVGPILDLTQFRRYLLCSRSSFLQILLRKGGIREGAFKPQAKNFLLFPTVFHTEEPLLKPGAAQRYQQVRGST
jgi:hypothetical protein